MTIGANAITAIVLCGGRGTRMGGRDKPLMDYRGRPSIARITEALDGCVATVLISANRNLANYRRYGTVVRDELDDQGPLAGMASCLNRCATPYAFVCPGDGPNLQSPVIQRLAESLESTGARIAAAHDGQRRQHLHLLLHADLRPDIDAYLATGARSVKGWLAAMAAADADCANLAASFADLDEPADFDNPSG